MSLDEKCLELAQYFVDDKDYDYHELAQSIQDHIEDWLSSKEVE